MSSNEVVLPSPIVEPQEPKVFSKVIISVVNIELGSYADIQATLLEDLGVSSKIVSLRMSGDDYTAWSSDDSYVVSWVVAQLSK